ncbi:UNVERIFIED_CONTAM: regulatory protein [Acetivibrio alkalicellulosi]
MKITSVEKNKKNKKMYSVFIDDKYAFSLSEEDYYRLSFYDIKSITEEEIEFIKKNILFKTAKSQAIKYLSFKLLSEKELSSKLLLKGFDEDVIKLAIDELKSMGYLNDVIYAQKYVYERIKLKPKSKKMLRFELLNKGICEDIIEEVLSDLEYDEDVLIERLVRKKFGKYDLNDPVVTRKVYSFLMHRGFSLENIKVSISKIKMER